MGKLSTSFMMLLALAVFVTSWLTFLEVHKKSQIATVSNSSQTIDFYMRGVDYVQLDEKGALLNHLKTPDLIHYPKEDTYIFQKPDLNLLDENKVPWHILASSGQSKNGISTVDFLGGVTIRHEMAPGSGHFLEVTSPVVTYYPKEHYADSKELVIIAEPGSIVHSIGARVDFLKKSITLLSQIQGQYVPGEKK